MPKAQILDQFFNDLTADEIDGLIAIVAGLDPYEMRPNAGVFWGTSGADEPVFPPAHQFVIERFIDLKQRLDASAAELMDKQLAAQFGLEETVIDTV
jgi:hypothetical protein